MPEALRLSHSFYIQEAIDALVYEMYGLTGEEVNTVEPERRPSKHGQR
jgi:hypothetical protein